MQVTQVLKNTKTLIMRLTGMKQQIEAVLDLLNQHYIDYNNNLDDSIPLNRQQLT